MAYRSAGAGDVPVICLHGIGGDASFFEPQLAGLSGSRRIVSVDLPGYGASDPLEETTFEALSSAVIGLLDAFEIEKAHLCGHSIGGMIAIETACRYGDRVASLALIATTSAFGGQDDTFKEAFVAARLKPLDAGKTLAELARAFIPEITGPRADKAVLAAATASMAAVPESTYRDIIRCLVTFNRRQDIASLPQPACLIAGEVDHNAPSRTMARMAAAMGSAEFHEIAGAGHLVSLEAAEDTNHILSAFYGRLA